MSLIPHDHRAIARAGIVADNYRITSTMCFLFFIVSNQDIVFPSYLMVISDDMISIASQSIVIPHDSGSLDIPRIVIRTNDRCMGRIGHFVFVTIDHIVLGNRTACPSQCIPYTNKLRFSCPVCFISTTNGQYCSPRIRFSYCIFQSILCFFSIF